MILIPAIDLKEGKCVRLERGEMAKATIYSDDPGRQARSFMEMGFPWLHIVDLDGAVAGETRNEEAIDAIIWCVANRMKVELGGGIRERKTIDDWLDKGVGRVILGTAALRDPDLVRAAARDHPGGIAVGIDARDGRVAVEGWAETSDMEPVDLARRFEDAGVAAIIHTDIERDGMLAGVNWAATIALAEAVTIPVIASGGVASMADIERLTQPDAAKLAGVIAGRALYDGRIDAKKAMALLARRQ